MFVKASASSWHLRTPICSWLPSPPQMSPLGRCHWARSPDRRRRTPLPLQPPRQRAELRCTYISQCSAYDPSVSSEQMAMVIRRSKLIAAAGPARHAPSCEEFQIRPDNGTLHCPVRVQWFFTMPARSFDSDHRTHVVITESRWRVGPHAKQQQFVLHSPIGADAKPAGQFVPARGSLIGKPARLEERQPMFFQPGWWAPQHQERIIAGHLSHRRSTEFRDRHRRVIGGGCSSGAARSLSISPTTRSISSRSVPV